jgi:hypothetical protein
VEMISVCHIFFGKIRSFFNFCYFLKNVKIFDWESDTNIVDKSIWNLDSWMVRQNSFNTFSPRNKFWSFRIWLVVESVLKSLRYLANWYIYFDLSNNLSRRQLLTNSQNLILCWLFLHNNNMFIYFAPKIGA